MECIKNTTESEQMYLVTIARLGELAQDCPIPISQVAEVLEVTPISANQMIHRLQQTGLVNYTPYKGVDFTEAGWQCASEILRLRRLWEVFLVQHLRYTPTEAEALACRLEHAIPVETADRLASFLDWPQTSPQGKTIPQGNTEIANETGERLSSLTAGQSGTVTAIYAGETEKAFLEQAGLVVGSRIEIIAIQQNGPCLLKLAEGVPVHLSFELSRMIYLKPDSQS